MKKLVSELVKNPKFVYLFGNFSIDLDETQLSLLGFPSSKKYEDAIMVSVSADHETFSNICWMEVVFYSIVVVIGSADYCFHVIQ